MPECPSGGEQIPRASSAESVGEFWFGQVAKLAVAVELIDQRQVALASAARELVDTDGLDASLGDELSVLRPQVRIAAQPCQVPDLSRDGASPATRRCATSPASWSRPCGTMSPSTGRCARSPRESAAPRETRAAQARLPAGQAGDGEADGAGAGGGAVGRMGGRNRMI